MSKAYGGVRALADVSLDILSGEVHALMGENGAGKSTLIKCLSGVVARDSGEVVLSGQPIRGGDVAGAEAAGIAVIHQESVAFPHLSAQDNIFMGREPRRAGGLLLDKGRMERETQALLTRLGESFDTRRPVGELSLAQRQMVGIARALSQKSRLLIMDEPTASLSARESEVLFKLVRGLRADGVSVLYVSHRMDEVFDLSDRVTVLRDGQWVATKDIRDITRPELIKLMVGREVQELTRYVAAEESGAALLPNSQSEAVAAFPAPTGDLGIGSALAPAANRLEEGDSPAPATAPAAESPRLEVKNLSCSGQFTDVSFTVRAGEIVGLAGLVGAGRSEVAQAIFGVTTPDGGEVRVGGAKLGTGSVPGAIARGVALVPEDRQHQGLVLPLSVGTNLILTVIPRLAKTGVRSRRGEQQLSENLREELQVKAANLNLPASSLSGGNQQKLVVGKWLATKPQVLILDEPTRGVDVGAKAEIYRLIRQLASEGMATLVISSDLPEVLALSDRILVMREGRISGELAQHEATQEAILALALPDAPPTPLDTLTPQDLRAA